MLYIDHAKAVAGAAALLAQNAIPAAHSAHLVKRLPEGSLAAPNARALKSAKQQPEVILDAEAEAPRTPEGSDEDEDVDAAVVGAADGIAACKL